MKILNSKFFCFKFFTLFVMIFMLSSKTVFAGFKGKVTAEAVQSIQAALTKVGAISGPSHADSLEKGLRASTAAHRLRLSEIFLHIQKDPDFVKKFPEYASLASNPSKTVEILLKHDGGKADPEGNLAMRALSLLQGYDYRNRNAGLPPEVDSQIRRVLKDAIDDVNELEKKYEMHGSSFDNKVGSLAEVLDYYDTFKSRQIEIAKDGRKLIGPNEWLDNLYGKKDLSLDAKKNLALQKRFAVYLETKDPLQFKSAFTQASDVLKKVGSNTVDDIAKYFHQGGKNLVRLPASVSNAKKVIGPLSKASKRVPVIGVALTGADYLVAPEDFSVQQTMEDTLTGLTFTGSTSACATVYCNQFMVDCQEKIDPKKTHSIGQIASHKKFGSCVFDFFQQPLEEQVKLRSDPDLNNLLMGYSPSIRSLTCEMTGQQLQVKIKTMKKPKQLESQVIQFNRSGQVAVATLLPDKKRSNTIRGKASIDIASLFKHNRM